MALRAPERGPRPEYTDTPQTVPGHWEPGRWWRVIDSARKVLAESSNPEDDGMRAALASPGAQLERSFVFVPAIHQWRPIPKETP